MLQILFPWRRQNGVDGGAYGHQPQQWGIAEEPPMMAPMEEAHQEQEAVSPLRQMLDCTCVRHVAVV